jgi:type I restriction enzyme S subunit
MVNVVSGATPPTGDPAYWDGEINWISAKGMQSETLFATPERITEAGVRAARLKILAPGTILMVTRGMILSHTVPVAITPRPMTVNQDIKALIPKTD